jgi:hypothetical protein
MQYLVFNHPLSLYIVYKILFKAAPDGEEGVGKVSNNEKLMVSPREKERRAVEESTESPNFITFKEPRNQFRRQPM